MKADYRYNPFTDKAEPVIKSELVKVPEVSPYIVRLEEVPQKTAPSSMRVAEVVIDESGTHEGSIFTEVAAFPASGEFFPDYYTSAEGDSSWNTGQILFNESETGKMLRVNYYGMGSIIWASDTAKDTEWYRDYGNGDDGEFAPEADVTISGVKNYTSVFVPQGVTVTIDKWAAIHCQEGFVNNGIITASGKGGAGGGYHGGGSGSNAGYPGASCVFFAGGTGGSNGSAGGAGGAAKSVIQDENTDYEEIFANNLYDTLNAGGGGGGAWYQYVAGSGGSGGGYIKIIALRVINNGTIEANGNNGSGSTSSSNGGGGGGGGGLIHIIASQYDNSGTLTANAGSGGWGGKNGGSGAAGKVFTKITG